MFGWLVSLFARLRGLEIRNQSKFVFIGEQDGPIEQELKERLTTELLKSPTVRRAYLARLGFADNNQEEVALCLSAPFDRELVIRVQSVFKNLFPKDAYMNVLFLTESLEQEVQEVCKPFFR